MASRHLPLVLRSPKALLLLRAASVLRLAVHKLAVHKRALPVVMVPLLLHRPVHMVLRPAKLVVMRRPASLISR